MSSEEKLEQSTIVKERGTVYFKVSQHWGPEDTPREGALDPYVGAGLLPGSRQLSQVYLS